MTGKFDKYGDIVKLVAIIGLLFVLSQLMVNTSFPSFQYTSIDIPRTLVPLHEFNEISTQTARTLWDKRSLDLTGQAFVIVTATIGCLALLKSTEEVS
jgi:hypothetical protein